MATGESLACLNHLLHRGEVERSLDADGVAWYALAAGRGTNAKTATQP